MQRGRRCVAVSDLSLVVGRSLAWPGVVWCGVLVLSSLVRVGGKMMKQPTDRLLLQWERNPTDDFAVADPGVDYYAPGELGESEG
ncbi:hypothetical protein F4823DRAFT_580229 [Ustulina deusta]|nr:hypothetical protein F4823DRAFT_580229 [Ustulina deusta]